MVKLKKIHHRGKDRLGLFFNYDEETIKSVKTLPYRKYSKTLKCWHLPYNNTNLNRVLDSGLKVDIDELTDEILNPGLPPEVCTFIENKAHQILGKSKNSISSDVIDQLKLRIQNWESA